MKKYFGKLSLFTGIIILTICIGTGVWYLDNIEMMERIDYENKLIVISLVDGYHAAELHQILIDSIGYPRSLDQYQVKALLYKLRQIDPDKSHVIVSDFDMNKYFKEAGY